MFHVSLVRRLTRLASELKRVEPYSERFHLDVAHGHYVPNLLFFPDLVRQLRPLTKRPFEVHLMVSDPQAWIGPFIEAGADWIVPGSIMFQEDPAAMRDWLKRL